MACHTRGHYEMVERLPNITAFTALGRTRRGSLSSVLNVKVNTSRAKLEPRLVYQLVDGKTAVIILIFEKVHLFYVRALKDPPTPLNPPKQHARPTPKLHGAISRLAQFHPHIHSFAPSFFNHASYLDDRNHAVGSQSISSSFCRNLRTVSSMLASVCSSMFASRRTSRMVDCRARSLVWRFMVSGEEYGVYRREE